VGCPADTLLIALVEHTLEPPQLRDVEHHLDSCSECRKIVAAALARGSTTSDTVPAEEGELAAITDVAISERYVIKSLLGRGGMGAVYLARDLSLGRDVALKVHRAGSGNDRLHREAIAMAQLAHPNVVTVYEVGSADGRLYVAMEYVRGHTLRDWLTAAPRTWREIVDIMIAAGAGLAAAHAADLVHRDFKPENVLVGEDGRPRVTDFGLARVDGRTSGVIPLTPGSADLDTPMTVTGALMGTPAYMPPEQIAGAAVDARSDQFAFCVVAWELLFGTRPFVGPTLTALALAIERREIQRPPRTAVPDRVREVLERGLASDPSARYPDVPTLLTQLRAAAVPRSMKRRFAIAAVALVPVAAAAVVIALPSNAQSPDRCKVPDDAMTGVWDAQLRDKVRSTFNAVEQGAALFQRTSVALDDYRREWIDMRRASCEATRVRGEQSETLLDLRMACLDRKRDELRALSEGLAAADRPAILGSVRAALGLSPIAACADKLALSAPVRPPEPQLRGRIESERSALAEVRALRLLGRTAQALEKAEAIATRAKGLGYRPLEAEALLVLGDLKDRSGDTATAIKLLEQAVLAADAGNHRLVAAEAWSTIAWLEGYVERHFDRAQWAVQMAAAAIEGVGGNDELAMQLLNYEGLILETKKQFEPAKAKYLAALAAREKKGDRDSWKVAMVLNDLGSVERKLGNLAAARGHHERALAIRKRVFGEQHPYVFSSLNNLGAVAWSQNDYHAAEDYFRKALAVARAIFPPQHPQTALAYTNIASALEHQNRFTEAIDAYRHALAIYEATRGPDHPDVADTLHNLGNVLAGAEQPQEAAKVYERALAILEAKGDDDPALASVLTDYGDLLARSGNRKGEPMLRRALALLAKAGPDEPDQAFALTALGELYATTGRTVEATPMLERALALRATESDEDKARTQFALAKLLWRRDRARSLELARAAQHELEASAGKEHRAVTQWLESHH